MKPRREHSETVEEMGNARTNLTFSLTGCKRCTKKSTSNALSTPWNSWTLLVSGTEMEKLPPSPLFAISLSRWQTAFLSITTMPSPLSSTCCTAYFSYPHIRGIEIKNWVVVRLLLDYVSLFSVQS